MYIDIRQMRRVVVVIKAVQCTEKHVVHSACEYMALTAQNARYMLRGFLCAAVALRLLNGNDIEPIIKQISHFTV